MSAPAVAVVTLGCARNEVDSEELAGRLTAEGWRLVERPDDADAVLVNTCGFVEAAKTDSINALLEAADGAGGSGRKVVAVGCLAERYGTTLARSLPEADAVLGFDDYPDIAARLADVVAGRPPHPHTPRDRRLLLPVTPVDRQPAGPSAGHPALPTTAAERDRDYAGPPSGPTYRATPLRRRLAGGPVAPLKLATGCDRRCSFCAIPSFRGSFVSRRPAEVLSEARWLAEQGVRELVLVSENSTSYGKDLGDLRLLETLLPELAAVPGILRVRLSYLQPAELRPSLVEVLASTPGVAPYFDLSFQHASATVLRRMRRFGGTERFLALLDDIRAATPESGIRSNVIVGFPGERRADVTELARFLESARLDAIGVFGYSDEDGTEAAGLPGKVRRDAVARRLDRISRLAEELTAQRAEDRIGTLIEVLIEAVEDGPAGAVATGRGAHQAPEVDGTTSVRLPPGAAVAVGSLLRVRVSGTDGVDLLAEAAAPVASGRPGAASTGSAGSVVVAS